MVSIDRKKLQEACTPSQFKALWTLAMVRNVDRNNTSQRCAIAPHCFKCLPARWGGGMAYCLPEITAPGSRSVLNSA